LHGAALERDAVCGDGLQDDGGADDGRDAVVADAAVAEGVAVDLVFGSVMELLLTTCDTWLGAFFRDVKRLTL